MDKLSLKEASSLAYSLLKKNFRQIEKGKNNWVFEDSDKILMVPRHKRVEDYSIRIAATKELASNGVPVAEILEYSENKYNNLEYLIVRRIEGSNVDLSETSQKKRDCVHESAGEVLKMIHNIPGNNYGRFNKNLKGNNKSWKEFTDEFFKESLRRVRLTPRLWNKYGSLLIDEYEKGEKILTSVSTPSFLHGDFHIGNLFFNNYKVVAVLDLDIVTSGDRNWDTGHYSHTFNIDRKRGIDFFKKGYGKFINNNAERLYSIIIWTRKIGSQAIQRPGSLKETLPELERILSENN